MALSLREEEFLSEKVNEFSLLRFPPPQMSYHPYLFILTYDLKSEDCVIRSYVDAYVYVYVYVYMYVYVYV